MAHSYNYTLVPPGSPETRSKRGHSDILSPSDENNDGLEGAPPTSRMREYTSPGPIADTQNMSYIVKSAICSPEVMKAICDNMSNMFETMLKPLNDKLDKQVCSINTLTSDLAKQTAEVKNLKSENVRLKQRVAKAEEEIEYLYSKSDDMEQYSRRTTLRFFNVSTDYQVTKPNVHTESSISPKDQSDQPADHVVGNSGETGDQKVKDNFENIIIDICNNKINVSPPISEEDIERVHPVGSEKDGKIQLMCKFKSWKVKHRVFSQKRNLKSKKSESFKVFLSEDLTKKRHRVVKALEDARKNDLILSHWTSDGRIFFKQKRRTGTVMVKDMENVNDLLSDINAWASGSWENPR